MLWGTKTTVERDYYIVPVLSISSKAAVKDPQFGMAGALGTNYLCIKLACSMSRIQS